MLLKEQGTLQTPVGVFAVKHEADSIVPEQAQFYKQLIPLSKPGAGEQYAFKVDLDKCTGCKACVSACHSLNGLDEDETWRDVGTIHGVDLSGASYTQTVTTACHHCVDPACLNGCPVLAYEKDPVTGIVRHLDDQCIGCQYCALKCPYDVPKYSKNLGIVRKCDMCQSRLAEGEAPACVQACPTEAISIMIVNTESTVLAAKQGGSFLQTAPEPSYTVPSTQYVTERTIPEDVEAADRYTLRPEHGHLPLVVMLVLTQLSVGLYGFSLFADAQFSNYIRLAAFMCMGIGLASSTSHLGRPLGAWRAFLGLRRSWLSREIVTFGLFSGVAAVYTGASYVAFLPDSVSVLSGWATFIVGLIGVFTSVMIYHDTHRPFWNFPITAIKFFGTTLSLAASGCLVFATMSGGRFGWLLGFLFFGIVSKLILEFSMLRSANEREMSPAKKSAMLLLHPLRSTMILRFTLSGVGLFSAGLLLLAPTQVFIAVFSFICLLGGELLERLLYFRAVAAPKMPGGFN
jgi:Fe-S-cluster-containing dehydrogenase component/DMSO reductase anchor subunit